jgi:hypothetical protein
MISKVGEHFNFLDLNALINKISLFKSLKTKTELKLGNTLFFFLVIQMGIINFNLKGC